MTLCDQVVLILRLLWNCKSVIGMLTSGLPNFTRGQSSHVCFQPFHRCVYSPPPRINLFLQAAEAAAESIICQMHGGDGVYVWMENSIFAPFPPSPCRFQHLRVPTCGHASLLCDALGGVTAAAGRRFHANFCPRHLSALHWAVRRQLQGTRIQPLSWCGISCS